MKKIIISFLSCFFALAGMSYNAMAQNLKVIKPKVEKHDFAKEQAVYDADMKRFELLQAQGKDIPEELMYLTGPDGDCYTTVGDGCSWYCSGGPSQVIASSSLKPQGKYTYKGECAHDFSLRTPWCEGVEGNGIGESLTYKFDTNFARITQVKIANGFVLNSGTYYNNARAKKIRLDYNGKPYAILELQDVIGIQTFDVGILGENPELKKPYSLKFTILEAYNGTKYQDLCISEIWFDGIDDH